MYGDITNTDKFDIKDVNEELVYAYYLGFQPSITKYFISPFRVNGRIEKTPSFNFVIGSSNGRLLFKCFSSGLSGSCVDLVMYLHNLDYSQALKKIENEIYHNKSLCSIKIQGADVPINEICRVNRVEKMVAKIEIIPKEFDLLDSIYWGKYGLNKSDLEFWDVKPCQEVWVNNRPWYEYRKTDPCYRYRISDRLKVYRPNIKGKDKWRNNASKEDIQGFSYLPDKGELLIITKSYKDIMVLKKHLGLPSISFSSESSKIEEEIVDYLYSRFDNIIIWYDNDEPGIKHGNLISEETGIPNVYIPTEYEATDPAALFKKYGKVKFTEVSKQLLKF